MNIRTFPSALENSVVVVLPGFGNEVLTLSTAEADQLSFELACVVADLERRRGAEDVPGQMLLPVLAS
jgi:hypothetical protein